MKPRNLLHLSADSDGLLYPATMGKYDLERVVQPIWKGDVLEFRDVRERTVPGRGQTTSSKCGQEIGFYACPDCGEIEKWTHNCSKAECQVCSGHWLKRRTRESGRRLKQIAKLLHRAPYHITLSAGSDWDGSTKQVLKMLRMIGIVGGCKLFHAWRFREKSTGQPIAWKRTDINPCSEEKVPSYGLESPHWHILGWIDWSRLMKSDEFQKRTGWVYRNHGKREGKEIYRTLGYQLSHVTLDGRKQTVTWFGITANNKLVTDVVEEYQAKLCPKCRIPMVKYQYYYGEPVKVENRQRVRMKYYRFKGARV